MNSLLALAAAMLIGTGGFDAAGILEVRIEGFLNGSEQEIKPWEMFQVRVGDGPLVPFALTNVIVLSAGDATGSDVVSQAEFIRPNFIFAGDKSDLETIRTSQPNQLLKITGNTNLGSQWVLVNRVERSAPITSPTPKPSLREKLLGF
jgi:hypothetical protein